MGCRFPCWPFPDQAQDFSNDKKNVGELGTGHTVMTLYELVPVGPRKEEVSADKVDEYKYQQARVNPEAATSGDVLPLKLRYKESAGNKSRLFTSTVAAQAVKEETNSAYHHSPN
ncbi:YfbK domain-containing protein [Pontibacter kalidii]|uniref:YfbK domain-containing protein n=1 Tax=Pontibacter kalidii TaxID=2592049 RepID=UPI00225AA9ED|nr:YfbK domain-containing protein [Pontibacter kalidii]